MAREKFFEFESRELTNEHGFYLHFHVFYNLKCKPVELVQIKEHYTGQIFDFTKLPTKDRAFITNSLEYLEADYIEEEA